MNIDHARVNTARLAALTAFAHLEAVRGGSFMGQSDSLMLATAELERALSLVLAERGLTPPPPVAIPRCTLCRAADQAAGEVLCDACLKRRTAWLESQSRVQERNRTSVDTPSIPSPRPSIATLAESVGCSVRGCVSSRVGGRDTCAAHTLRAPNQNASSFPRPTLSG